MASIISYIIFLYSFYIDHCLSDCSQVKTLRDRIFNKQGAREEMDQSTLLLLDFMEGKKNTHFEEVENTCMED